MNRTTFLLAALALPLSLTMPALPTHAQDNNDTPYQTKTFSGNVALVRAETSGGSLHVVGDQATGVRVEMYVRLNNGNENVSQRELEERLKAYDISIRQEGSNVVASAKRRSGFTDWKRSVSVSFKIHTPRQMATDLQTSGGSIRLASLAGRQRFETSGGSLHLTNVVGDVDGRTSGGSIHVADCRAGRSENNMKLKTSGGSIEALNSDGTLTMQTSGGSIRLRDLRGTIRAETSGGSIQGEGVEGELITGTSGGSVRLRGIRGSLAAETSAGSMEVEIARLGDYVKLSNSGGSVRVQMPFDKGLTVDVRGNKVKMPLNNFNGDFDDDRVRGKINGGGIPVTINAGSGNVYVNQN